MADIKTAVLTVDTGGAITNIKDFKGHIDNLKGTLLGLEKGTEEYNTVAKELRDSQQKLNEVMDVAKGKGEAVAGSYDNLVKTMADLKKEWRATGDVVERAKLGEKILSINNQLKDLDASTGNFQRNVGDYSNAFSKAFEVGLKGLSKGDSMVAQLSGDIKNLIPIIKAANTTAVKGLSGVKKAIASTGIGALIIAVGLLITNWDKFLKIIGISDEKFGEFKTKALDVLKNIVSGVVGVGNVLVNAFIAPVKALIQYFTTLGKLAKDFFTGNWKNFKKSVDEGMSGIKDSFKKGFDLKGNYEQGKQAGENFINGISSRLKSGEGDVKKEGDKIGKAIVSGVDKELEAIQRKADEIIKRLEDSKKTELELLKDKYEEEKAILEIAGRDTTELTDQYEKERLDIIKKRADEELAIRTKTAQESLKVTEKGLKEQYDRHLKDLNYNTRLDEFTGGTTPGGLFSNMDIEAELEKALAYNDEILRIRRELNEGIIAENQKILDSFPESEENAGIRLEAMTAISEAEMEINDAVTENTIANLEAQDKKEEDLKKRRQERLNFLADGLTSIASIFDMVADHQQKQIEQELKDGKISEQTAKKRFEDTKKMQIAAAVVNMAAGVVSAIAQAQQLGPIAGPIVAALNSAAVITAGAIQIANIKSTNFGGGKVDTTTTSTPDVTRIVNEYTPEYTQNITADSELTRLSNAINDKPLFVSVTDINSVQNTVKVREEETSF